jgi:hypothetical protein
MILATSISLVGILVIVAIIVGVIWIFNHVR